MQYPLISEYIDAILDAEENFSRLSHLRPVLDDAGRPVMSSGNFAAVFKMTDGEKFYAIKCFTREQEGREEAYELISDELNHGLTANQNSDVRSYLAGIEYIDHELFVDSSESTDTEFPVLLMDWIDGVNLEQYIDEHKDDCYALHYLYGSFCRMAIALLESPIAHGDLKPDNILVRKDGSIVLVDYDGMYVPAMKGQKARELGSPDFRHPQRTINDFDDTIDIFAIATMGLSLAVAAYESESNAIDVRELFLTQSDYSSPNSGKLARYLNNASVIPNAQTLLREALDNIVLSKPYIISCIHSSIDPTGISFCHNGMTFSFDGCNLESSEEKYKRYLSDKFGETSEDLIGAVYSKDKRILYHFPFNLEIQEYWIFQGCEEIAENAFKYIPALGVQNKIETLHIPNTLKRIGFNALRGCQHLRNICIDIYNEERIISLLESYKEDDPNSREYPLGSSMLIYETRCSDEEKANGVLDEFGVLYSADGLKLLDGTGVTPYYAVKPGTKIICNYAFSGHDIPIIILPDSLIAIGGDSFNGCSIEHITIPKNVKQIGDYAFSSTDLLSAKIDGPIRHMGCKVFQSSHIKYVELGENVMDLGNNIFKDCTHLEEIRLPKGLRHIEENPFVNSGVKEIINDSPAFEIKDGTLIQKGNLIAYIAQDTQYTIPKGIVSIGDSAFHGNDIIVSIDIPDSVRTIGYSAFRNCEALMKISLPSTLQTIGSSAFYGCERLEHINLPTTLESIEDGVFSFCNSLDSIVIPNGVSSIEDRAFSFCNALTNISLPSSLVYIGIDAFYGCEHLEHINLPTTLETIENGVFGGCVNLRSISIPDGIRSIENHTFYKCKALRNITLPSALISIGDCAFYGCEHLESINLPPTLSTIEDKAFKGCSSLNSIDIPASVIHIGNDAFSDTSIQEIYVHSEFTYSELLRYTELRDKLILCNP